MTGNLNIFSGTGNVIVSETGNPQPAMIHKITRIPVLLSILIIVLLVIAILIFVIVGKIDKHPQKQVESEPPSLKTHKEKPIELIPQHYDLLTIDQIHYEVRKALQTDNVSKAIDILMSIENNIVKEEECTHIYLYCIKNNKFNEAIKIVTNCWEGQKKEEALKEIEKEKLKSN